MNEQLQEVFADLDAGIFANKIAAALGEVAMGVINNGTKGKVTIELNLAKMSNETQVMITHQLKYSKPTSRGKLSEEDTTETPMYVNRKGELSLMQKDQGDMFGKEPLKIAK